MTKPISAHCDAERLHIELADGRRLSVPLTWLPRLLAGTHEQRQKVWLSPLGLHWDALDEDISVPHLLTGYPSVLPPAQKKVNMTKYTVTIEQLGDEVGFVLPPEVWARMESQGWIEGEYHAEATPEGVFIRRREKND